MKVSRWSASLFLLPNLLGFLAFTFLPIIASLVLAFCNWDLFGAPQWVGWGNLVDLLGFSLPAGKMVAWWRLSVTVIMAGAALILYRRGRHRMGGWCAVAACLLLGVFFRELEPHYPRFWQSLGNTFFLMLGLPVSMLGSLLLAMALNRTLYGNRFFRLIYFLPSMVGGVGIFLLWKWIFNPDYGPLQQMFLAISGHEGPRWLESVLWVKPALMVMGFWGSVGGTNMVLYLAALQNISPELIEAARIDGAGLWHRFRHIVLPMVSSTTFFILIMGVIHGFQGGFDAAYVMTRGGPAGASTTTSYFIYESAFAYYEMGRASAASLLLFLLVMVFTWINWKMAGEKVHYA